MIRPAEHAVDQYGATTGNLTARVEVAAAGVFRVRRPTVLITARRQPSAT